MNPQAISDIRNDELNVSQQVAGNPLSVGTGFEALSFKYDQFDGLMDPLVMLDHYTMTSPTFGAHPHAGMSAVSILFEDSEGVFNNRDSLGNNIDLLPGDLYWLKAGSGAIHDEKPTPGSRTHGLQIFVNLPRDHKFDAPASLHIPASEMPVIAEDGYRVRVVLGESNGIQGAVSPALPFTALDGFLEPQASYSHKVEGNQSFLIYAVSGDLKLNIGDQEFLLPEHQALAIQLGEVEQQLQIASTHKAHFAVLQGTPIKEQFIQKGPFVMSSTEQLNQVMSAYEAGLLGSIAE